MDEWMDEETHRQTDGQKERQRDTYSTLHCIHTNTHTHTKWTDRLMKRRAQKKIKQKKGVLNVEKFFATSLRTVTTQI